MEMSLKNYREELADLFLHLLWRQWCTYGVFGSSEPARKLIIDPEALILLTCSIGRSDPRLFDEMVDWISINWELVNVSRINFMLKRHRWIGSGAIAALSNWMMINMGKKTKWVSLTAVGKQETQAPLASFFLDRSGGEMAKFGNPEPSFAEYGFFRGELKLRKQTLDFHPDIPSNLLLALRSFFGTNVRAEIVAYLLSNPGGTYPSLLAREISSYQKTVHQALVSMARSGLVESRDVGREKIFVLVPRLASALQSSTSGKPIWINWVPLCVLFENVWSKASDNSFLKQKASIQSIELRESLSPLSKEICHPAFSRLFSEHLPSNNFIEELVSGIRNFIATE